MKLRRVGENVTEITLKDGTQVLFSYATAVAAFVPGKGYIRTQEFYSRTTSRHIGGWLNSANCAEVPQADIDALVEGE